MSLMLLINTTAQELQLDNAVESLTKSTIELAEAASNYGALKVIFGLFMVFVIILVVMFMYTIYNLNKKVSSISESSNRVNEFFEGAADHTVGVTEAQIIVRREFNCVTHIIKYAILRIRLENHIQDKESIKRKVDRFVNNEYNEFCGFLSNFLCNGRPLSEIMDNHDNEIVKEFMMEQIYIPKEEFSISNMDQAVTMYMNGIKLMYLKKL